MEGLDNQIPGKESLTLQVTACIVFVPVMDIDGFKVISHEDIDGFKRHIEGLRYVLESSDATEPPVKLRKCSEAVQTLRPNWWRWRKLKLLHFKTNWDQLEKVKVTQFVWYHWKTETIVLKYRRIDIEPTDQV